MNKFFEYFNKRIKDIWFLIIVGGFGIFGIGCGFYFIFSNGSFRNIWMSFASGLLVPIGFIVFEFLFKMKLPPFISFLIIYNCLGGMIIGPLFDWFVKYEWYDQSLHMDSGLFIFLIGYALGERIIRKDLRGRGLALVLFSFFLSSFFVCLWEMYEYFCSSFLGLDMQDDMIIKEFGSTLLANSNNWVLHLYDITKTVIYHGNGETYIIEGGYLDIGMFDTLNDILLAFIGMFAGTISLLINKFIRLDLKKYLIPTLFEDLNDK